MVENKNKTQDKAEYNEAMQVPPYQGSQGWDSDQRGMQPSMLDQQIPDEEIPVPSPPQSSPEFGSAAPSSFSIPSSGGFSMQQPVMINTQATNEELIESIIEEKWQHLLESVGDIEVWKSRVNDELAAIKQEVLRISSRVDNLQTSVLGRVREHGKNMEDVGSEIKALEKVLQDIIQPLTSNVKELSEITNSLRGRPNRDTSRGL